MGTLLKAANPSPAMPPVSTLPNAARTRAAALVDFAGFKSEKAAIQSKCTSGRLYLNKLLRRRGDASLAILTYHFERASYSVQRTVTRATPVQAYGTADAPATAGRAAVARLATLSREFAPDLGIVIHDNLEAVESEWRRFEDIADCTAFQSFDWLATWYRHIGQPDGVRPVIVVGSYADGETAFILPLAIARKHGIKRLCWFGQEQCDYNAPLLARDFSQRVSPECFLAALRALRQQMQRDPRLRHDWIELEKMPQLVGAQANPFMRSEEH